MTEVALYMRKVTTYIEKIYLRVIVMSVKQIKNFDRVWNIKTISFM